MCNTKKYLLYMQVAGSWLQQLEDASAECKRNCNMNGWLTLALDVWMVEHCNA